MAFLDLDSPPQFAQRRAGAVLRIHQAWLTADDAVETAPRRSFGWVAGAAFVAVAAAVHFWTAAALQSQLLGLATTGIVAAIALSLFTAPRR